MTDKIQTWCPLCGCGVAVDEDGCCATCGADATGPGVDAIFAALLDAARDGCSAENEAWLEKLRGLVAWCQEPCLSADSPAYRRAMRDVVGKLCEMGVGL